ncbi:MAG: FAD-dependent oxidoreductase [Planctomycetes bacterium]|nr:FAD-dependent oxidoreductase [Planctomycetota bacterium]
MNPPTPPVLVIGAGMAGLSAALELAKAGLRITLAERRPFPGGRSYSFRDPSGAIVDNGQHVILECCAAYRSFLEDIGASDRVPLQQRTLIPFVDARTGETTWIQESWLPAPLHFLPSLLAYKPLSWRDRRLLLRAGRAMRKDRGTDGESLGAWLRRHGQSEDAIRLFWNHSSMTILNDDVDRVSAEQGLFAFRTCFFERREAARVGVPDVPLGEIADRAVARIRQLGGVVEFNRKIDRLPEGPVISAVPARALLDLLPRDQVEGPFFSRAAGMKTSPIVNLHFLFDAPIEAPRFFACVGGRIHWVFARDAQVTLSQSGARDLMDRPNAELQREFFEELKRVLPAVRDRTPKRCVIVRERDATFVPAPGAKGRRLPCVTPIPNLFLAGEWTEGEWPSTMEAAVLSGRRAATEAIRRLTPEPSGRAVPESAR